MTVLERAYFLVCRALGRLLRAGRYSTVRVVDLDGELHVRKGRSFYAPLLVALGEPIVTMLDTGMTVLPQPEWEERESLVYRTLYGSSVQVDRDGTLILPFLPGETLATLLDHATLGAGARCKAIELAVAALVDFHAKGFTHGDAMAENVMVDLDAGVARWFDFETAHDTSRPIAWRRADDLRALLSTSLLRTASDDLRETLQLVIGGYANETITRLVATTFASVLRRPLAFHLGQAALAIRGYETITQLLNERSVD